MKLDRSMLLRFCPTYPRERVDVDVSTFNLWRDDFGITTPQRICHFFAQIAHESGGFKRVEENLNYTAERLLVVFPKYFNSANVGFYAGNPKKIASRIYANRMGNGDEDSMEGWKYRGRGYIQITGKDNYRAYERSGFCVGTLTDHPDWLCETPGRMKSAMWFWWKNGCNKLADAGNINAITKRINGGLNGLADRKYYLRKAERVFMLY